MRYEKGRKDATRRRILEVAAGRFRRDGIAASGLAGIMGDAGLTNGAFYPHFPSKAALVRDSVAAVLEDQAKRLRKILATGGLEGFIAAYLSPQHRDGAGEGCAAAALLPELARQPTATRRRHAEGFLAAVRHIAAVLPPQTRDRESVALAVYATLVGSLQLARATKGTALSDRVLAAGTKTARALGNTPRRRSGSPRRAPRDRSRPAAARP